MAISFSPPELRRLLKQMAQGLKLQTLPSEKSTGQNR
jgi:hypothetical protein